MPSSLTGHELLTLDPVGRYGTDAAGADGERATRRHPLLPHVEAINGREHPSVIEPTAERGTDVFLVGRRQSPHVQNLRDFLSRNRVTFGWVDLDHDPLVRALGARAHHQIR
jgi:hypothetical protein